MDTNDFIVVVIVATIAFVIGRILPDNPIAQLAESIKNLFKRSS